VIRKLGVVLIAVGGLLLAWVGVTVTWGDPATSLYTRHEQHVLSKRLAEMDDQWRASGTAVAAAKSTGQSRRLTTAQLLRSRAARFERTVRDGSPIGWIVIPRLGLRMVVVEGTTASDLERGLGHYDTATGRDTSLPGMGGMVAIAGHRTTYLHPFLHIDSLRAGDSVELRMPYGRFDYRVTGHVVVDSSDWSILRPRAVETLVLTACHPPHSASHRWVVFARLASSHGL